MNATLWLDKNLKELLNETLTIEKATAYRDIDIAAVHIKYGIEIRKSAVAAGKLALEIEEFYKSHRKELEPIGRKSLQLDCGLIGFRAPSNPELVPLNEKWTPAKITSKLKRIWKARFFHRPKPPGIDKVKIKRELDAEQLAAVGLKLDTEEQFYVELNRLAKADEAAA